MYTYEDEIEERIDERGERHLTAKNHPGTHGPAIDYEGDKAIFTSPTKIPGLTAVSSDTLKEA